jgi:hypothetical protein
MLMLRPQNGFNRTHDDCLCDFGVPYFQIWVDVEEDEEAYSLLSDQATNRAVMTTPASASQRPKVDRVPKVGDEGDETELP